MPIKIHNDESGLKGAVNFLNQSVQRYFLQQEASLSSAKQSLKQAMKGNLYLTDLRLDPKDAQKAQVDLVEMKQGAQGVEAGNCFTLRVNRADFKFEGQMKTPELNAMSKASQEMVENIQETMDQRPSSPGSKA